jgi:transcriptional regulator with XRE-family HTH domain
MQRGLSQAKARRARDRMKLHKRNSAGPQPTRPATTPRSLSYGVRVRNTTEPQRDAWAKFAKAARGRMTQSELARQLGVDRATIYRWETGQQRPENADTVARFAQVTGIDVDEALAAAGLKPGAVAPAEPTRELDEEEQLIMRAPVGEAMKQRMLDKLHERRERERQQRIADFEFLIEQSKRD